MGNHVITRDKILQGCHCGIVDRGHEDSFLYLLSLVQIPLRHVDSVE